MPKFTNNAYPTTIVLQLGRVLNGHQRGPWYAWLTLKDQITLRLRWLGYKDVTLLVGDSRIVWDDAKGNQLAVLKRICVDQKWTFAVSGSDSLTKLWVPALTKVPAAHR